MQSAIASLPTQRRSASATARTASATPGPAFSVNVLVARASLDLTGTSKSHQTTGTENGHLCDRSFCADCGTPILTILHERPDLIIVKAGTLDDPSGLHPVADVWWRRAQDWLDPTPTRPHFEGDAP